MNTTANITIRAPWRPLFWEPVAGTGERLMVGVLYGYDGKWKTELVIRDDVLDALYGKAAGDLRKLFAQGFKIYRAAAEATNSISELHTPFGGLYPGALRETVAASEIELLRTACLLYSSLANMDRFDEVDESDNPMPEEVQKRFSTEVRNHVLAKRPDLANNFGKGGQLIKGGQIVRFGFFSPDAILHFSVLHPVRQGPSVRDARARLWELARASELSGIRKTALITSVPSDDTPYLGARQRDQLRLNKAEIEEEADKAQIRLYPVTSAFEGAERVVEIVK